MKHSRIITQRYKALLVEESANYFRDLDSLKRKYEESVERLKKERQREIDALPDETPKLRNREDHTVKYCATCNGEMLTATVENAKRYAEATRSRGGEPSGWQYTLAGLRNKSSKYCCYHCQIGSGEHSARCKLRSVVDAALKKKK